MSTQTTLTDIGDASNGQTTLDTYSQGAAEQAGLTLDRTHDGEGTATDRRVERALNGDLYAEQIGASEWLVHSGSGARYVVDMTYPQSPDCPCKDDAQYCKHVWRIFLFGKPEFLMDELYGVGTALPSTVTHIDIEPGDAQ